MPQTSYSQYMGSSYPGLIADIQMANVIVSKSLETATINPGLVVSRGTDKSRQAIIGGTSPLGVVVRSMDTENNSSDELEYVATDTIGVMQAGVIWANVVGTGNPGDAIKYNTTTGVIGLGAVGGGEQLINGRLDSLQTVSGALARIVLLDPASAITYLEVTPIDITVQPTAQTAIVGAVATFTVTATGEATITYQWEVSTDSGTNWAEISGATSASYARTVADSDEKYQFRVQVSNDFGTEVSSEVALGVSIAITVEPTAQSAADGATATFSLTATGGATITYLWSVSDDSGVSWTPVSGATSASYAHTAATAENGYEYRCAVTNDNGTVTSAEVALTVT